MCIKQEEIAKVVKFILLPDFQIANIVEEYLKGCLLDNFVPTKLVDCVSKKEKKKIIKEKKSIYISNGHKNDWSKKKKWPSNNDLWCKGHNINDLANFEFWNVQSDLQNTTYLVQLHTLKL